MEWYAPEDVEKDVDQQVRSIPGERLFNDPEYKKLREKWCATYFGIGYSKLVKPCKLAIVEAEDTDTDFFLNAENVEYPFQLTEVLAKRRRRGKEYKDNKPGSSQPFGVHGKALSIDGLEQIVAGVQKKAQKYADETLNLLVYANVYAPDLEYSDILVRLKPWKDNFSTIWIISNTKICSVFSKPEMGEIRDWHKFK